MIDAGKKRAVALAILVGERDVGFGRPFCRGGR
jgi:hypothetical protein